MDSDPHIVIVGAGFGGLACARALGGHKVRVTIVDRDNYHLFVPLLYWQWLAPVRSVIRGGGGPSSELSYHQPLLDELARLTRSDGPFRVEVPFTANHWETRYVAPRFPLARGWERQLDVKLNGLFYHDGALTPASYRAWLDRLAVRYVALPGVKLDPSGAREGALVELITKTGAREKVVIKGLGFASSTPDHAHLIVASPTSIDPDALDRIELELPR